MEITKGGNEMSDERMQKILNTKLSEKDLIEQAGYYYDFTAQCFDLIFTDMYMNVAHINAILEIRADACDQDENDYVTFGQCYPGIVRVYLFSIMRVVPSRFIKDIIVGTIAHELKHINQINYSNKEISGMDINRDKLIERSVEWETNNYITEKKEFIETSLNIKINQDIIRAYQVKSGVLPTNLYMQTTLDRFWFDIIKYLVYPNEKIPNDIINTNILNLHENIGIQFINTDGVNNQFYSCMQYIKDKGNPMYPTDDVLKLVENIVSATDIMIVYKYGFSTTDKNLFLLQFEYTINCNSPIIKY